jgi:hypothetical protein
VTSQSNPRIALSEKSAAVLNTRDRNSVNTRSLPFAAPAENSIFPASFSF